MKIKRYNPLIIIFDLWDFIKNSFLVVIFLFIIKAGSDSLVIIFGQIAFVIFTIYSIIKYFLKWMTTKYELDDDSFHLYKGIFSKTRQTIPFSKIQNVSKQTTLLHRIFKVTSMQFDTGIAGENSAVIFEVITKQEANKIESHIVKARNNLGIGNEQSTCNSKVKAKIGHNHLEMENKTIHFTPTKEELFKASFTSLSFLMLIPFIWTIYFKIDEIYHLDEATETIVAQILNSSTTIVLIIIIFIIASIIFGVTRTFLKYGKYEISTDDERIYICRGILNEVEFSIEKNKVQAIQLNQSIIKRMLQLVEVKIISAGDIEFGDDSLEISVLYPFLSVERAHKLINKILPTYEITKTMERLPSKSFTVKLLKLVTFTLFVAGSSYFLKDSFGNFEQFWWTIPSALFFISVIFIFFDYINTRYTLNGEFVQFKKGSFATTLFLTKRDKIFEVRTSQNIFQKLFGLASIETINRAKPVHFDGVKDIPSTLAEQFLQWYCNRIDEIKIDKG